MDLISGISLEISESTDLISGISLEISESTDLISLATDFGAFFFFVSDSRSITPASPNAKITSCSGWCGLSTIRAIRFLPDFLK